MKVWRWLLVLPLAFVLAAPSLAQERFFPRGGGFHHGGDFRPGGGFNPGGISHGRWPRPGMPGPQYGDGAPPRHYWPPRRWPPRVYDLPIPPRHFHHPPPAMAEADRPPPPRRHFRRPVEIVRETPPPRMRRPVIAAAPPVGRALLPVVTEKRLAPDEILVAFKTQTPGQPQDFARVQKLDLIEMRPLKLIGVTVHRLKLPRGADLRGTLRRAGRDARIAWAQPNYFYRLQQSAALTPASAPAGPEGYAGAALNLAEAHKLARGKGVAVAVIDSQVDAAHPELAGVAEENFDPIGGASEAHAHGTAMAGAISGHVKLAGAAPAARLLAVRAFDQVGSFARGATLPIVAGFDWAAEKGAKVVSMSFAGPADPLMERMVVAAAARNMALIAAAGNEGPGRAAAISGRLCVGDRGRGRGREPQALSPGQPGGPHKAGGAGRGRAGGGAARRLRSFHGHVDRLRRSQRRGRAAAGEESRPRPCAPAQDFGRQRAEDRGREPRRNRRGGGASGEVTCLLPLREKVARAKRETDEGKSGAA